MKNKFYFGLLYKFENKIISKGFLQHKFNFNFICGFENNIKDLKEFYIYENKILKKLDVKNFRYCKITLSNKNKIDIITNRILLNPKNYKTLRENLDSQKDFENIDFKNFLKLVD